MNVNIVFAYISNKYLHIYYCKDLIIACEMCTSVHINDMKIVF